MPSARRLLGDAGEDAVAAWYEAAGFVIVARNWRVREGELDLVAAADDVLVFCEVKTRRSDRFGHPAEAVTAAKQARIRRVAARFLAETDRSTNRLRFDVAAVRPGRSGWAVEVIADAF
ncbi:MAG: YraN family protein [Actinomycetota bacterium]